MTKPTFGGMLTELLDDLELFGPEGACPTRIEPAGAAPRVLLITGDNASGKSFVCKAFGQFLTGEGASVEFVGMARRASSDGFQRMSSGDEGRQSTGQISVRTALRGMERLLEAPDTREAGRARVLILDEPDIGLSEAYAARLGQRIATFCATLPDDAFGVAVVTHNREIARAVAALGPTIVRVGDDLRPIADWLRDGPLPVDDAALDGLCDAAHDRYIRIVRLMEARKESARTARAAREAEMAGAIKVATERYRAVVRGASAYEDRERQAAERFLADLLDACAIGDGRAPGFSFSDGALLHRGKAVAIKGDVIIKGTRCGSGIKVSLAFGPRGHRDWRSLGEDVARNLYRAASATLPGAKRPRLLAFHSAAGLDAASAGAAS